MLASHEGVSDLILTVGQPLQVETSGQLKPVPIQPEVKGLTPFQAEVFALNLINGNKRLMDDLVQHGSCDLSYWLGDQARFRVNIFSQKKQLSTILRQLPTKVPTIDKLNLPTIMNNMSGELNGIIMVTGATGTGKSTTLAALLEKINRERPIHIITLEDPIEFVHTHKQATFNQRELGNDFDTFANGLRAALRQAPKVILVGEMRDRETMEIGLTAAETGHLVLSTLHTMDAGTTINRCIGMFNYEEQQQIRNRLADILKWVVSQRLLPTIEGDRTAAFEIMQMNLRIKEVIINGETSDKTFYSIIADSKGLGMTTFDQYILQLFQNGLITEETALSYCSRRSMISRGLDSIKSAKGEKTTGITGLSMEEEENQDRRR